MSQMEIFIDPSSPTHAELEQGLRQSLNALASISVRDEKRPVPSGTLAPGLEQVAAYVVQHPDKVVILATAVLNVINNLLRFRSTKVDKEGKPDKPVVIVVKDESLSLPASEGAQRKFLKQIEETGTEKPKNNKGDKRPAHSAKRKKIAKVAKHRNKRRK